MRGYLAAFLSALLAFALAPAPAAGEEEACHNDFVVWQGVVVDPSVAAVNGGLFDPHSSECGWLLPTTLRLSALWAPGVSGEEGLVVRVEGDGFTAFELPMTERSGTDPLGRPLRGYATESFPVPEGLEGTLHVTVLQHGATIRTEILSPFPQ